MEKPNGNYKLEIENFRNLWVLLRQTTDAIDKARGKELSQYGITTSQCYTMFVIADLGGKATVSQISSWLFREPHSVSSVLKTMELKGLVRKERSRERNSSIVISLTEKGQAILEKIDSVRTIVEILSALSKQEREQLQAILTRLREKGLMALVNHKWPNRVSFSP